MGKKSTLSQGIPIKHILFFLAIALLLASPFIYRVILIHEIYINPDVRAPVLDSVFFLREEYGITIGDLTIKDVKLTENILLVRINEEYHGLINKEIYTDLDQDYYVQYDYDADNFKVTDIISND